MPPPSLGWQSYGVYLYGISSHWKLRQHVPAKRLYNGTLERVRRSSLPFGLCRTIACDHNVRNALSCAVCVDAVPGEWDVAYCRELGAVVGCLAVMQEPHQLSQWNDGM